MCSYAIVSTLLEILAVLLRRTGRGGALHRVSTLLEILGGGV